MLQYTIYTQVVELQTKYVKRTALNVYPYKIWATPLPAMDLINVEI
jgi:hypothetical protein